MRFRTELTPPPQAPLSLDLPVMLLGSCFSDNMGAALSDHGFNVVANPTGPLYNPSSILFMLDRLLQGRPFTEGDLMEADGRLISLQHHSRFDAPTAQEALKKMNEPFLRTYDMLGRLQAVFITLGSTRRFIYCATHAVVANCHKLPAADFREEVMDFRATARCLDALVGLIHDACPQARIIFTVSPIRHLAYGLEGNSLSKATLRAAIAEVQATHPDVGYFPAYELLMDDLRDYRFYASDLKHPSDAALEYIWEKFADTYFDAATRRRADDAYRRTLSRRHRNNSR